MKFICIFYIFFYVHVSSFHCPSKLELRIYIHTHRLFFSIAIFYVVTIIILWWYVLVCMHDLLYVNSMYKYTYCTCTVHYTLYVMHNMLILYMYDTHVVNAYIHTIFGIVYVYTVYFILSYIILILFINYKVYTHTVVIIFFDMYTLGSNNDQCVGFELVTFWYIHTTPAIWYCTLYFLLQF
jgi:hypothetical protein